MNIPRPINAAEAVICPFWDPSLEELRRWNVEPGESYGLEVAQFWCWTSFAWSSSPECGPALTMSRRFDLDCSGYDSLIVSLVAPETSVFSVTVETDRGVVRFEAPPAGPEKTEHAVPLEGATRISDLTIEVYPGAPEYRNGWINWIGLATTGALRYYERQWCGYDERWEGYLKPESYEPEFRPSYGIVATREELSGIRRRHEEHVARGGDSPFTRMADEVRGTVPEESIGEYVNFFSTTRMTNDTRYNRERDHAKALVTLGRKAAIAAHTLEDPVLLRLAARYALSIAMCDHWEDGMVNAFPGSTFDTRCFVQSLCLHDVATILDLAGELFTDLGRQYLLRRLSAEGLAVVTYNTWKYDYLFSCNQLAWFTPGRILASLVVERTWPRAGRYTDICYDDLVENMERSILPDGGFVEGPNYFQCVGRDACLSFSYYARARGVDLESIVPEIIGRTDRFGEAIASTDASRDVIPICDSGSHFDQQAMAFLAHLMPDSAWSTMLGRSLAKSGLPTSISGYLLAAPAPRSRKPAPFVELPEMGLVASHREFSGTLVKLLVLGNHAGAGHTHEDKGSFVLEFAGETFAMDPGTADYSHPLANVLKGCERHNMLVPTGVAERSHPASPIDRDVKPVASGDGKQFEASVDLGAGWEYYFRSRRREFRSPEPGLIEIEDQWELSRGTGVVFYWNTTLPVETQNGSVTISGRSGRVVLTVPHGSVVSIDELPLPHGALQRRIGFGVDGAAGSIRVRAELGFR